MIATSRNRRATLRGRTRANRAYDRAIKAVATGAPQPVRTHLLAVGLPAPVAKRYSGAFSRGIGSPVTTDVKRKIRGRFCLVVPVKLVTADVFAARLATYRPKDPAAARVFAALAA
jgi:hypothetical protein